MKMNIINLVFLLVALCFTLGHSDLKVFNIRDYGAIEGGNVDSSRALLNAWNDACKWNGESRVEVTSTYLVNPLILKGPCVGPIQFKNSGTLKGPIGLRGDSWIQFHFIDRLSLFGGGKFDGQNSPKQGGPGHPTLLKMGFVTNSIVQNIKLLNSQSTHFHLFDCNQILIKQIEISSPVDSRNTDGIKTANSNNIQIVDSTIASGDDCVAIIRGSKDITVKGVLCGPGHGISIGSMGQTPNERVEGVVVQHCKLFNTTNGLRIKTWATSQPGLVSNILYEDITLDNVDNPILIEQNYCPSRPCAQGNSQVQISGVRFRNIRGTSQTNVAVNLQCSESHPCEAIELRDINIQSINGQQNTISSCSNVKGQIFGLQMPKPCNLYVRPSYIKIT